MIWTHVEVGLKLDDTDRIAAPMTIAAPIDTPSPGRTYLESLREAGSVAFAQRGDALCHEGERSSHVLLVASGYVVAVKRTAAGHQQNVALYVPGDIVDHEGFTLGVSRSGAVALTAVTFHKVSHARLEEVLESSAEHSRAFRVYVAFHGALAQEWLLSLGRRSAYARTAHLLCEIIHRTGAPTAADEVTCPMPLTQTELADTLGLSVVHVNRTLMRLRQEGLIRLRRGQIDVLDWPGFKAAAGFEPTYLEVAG